MGFTSALFYIYPYMTRFNFSYAGMIDKMKLLDKVKIVAKGVDEKTSICDAMWG